MKIYTRSEIKDLIKAYSDAYVALGGNRISLQGFCENTGLYYFGVVRFLKGSDCTAETYFKILSAADPDSFKELRHYLGKKIMYSEMQDLASFCKEAMITIR
jgi:uncharacterized protein YfbU (UPF0304 family)